MTPNKFPKEPMAQIEAILEYETGLPAEFFKTHSIEEIEERLGIPHYKLYKQVEDKRAYIEISSPYALEIDENILLHRNSN